MKQGLSFEKLEPTVGYYSALILVSKKKKTFNTIEPNFACYKKLKVSHAECYLVSFKKEGEIKVCCPGCESTVLLRAWRLAYSNALLWYELATKQAHSTL